MAISLDKILTISGLDYIDLSGKDHIIKKDDARYYDMVGIHLISNDPGNFHAEFAKKVPDNAEVVVNYNINIAGEQYSTVIFAQGTALIPKK